MNSKNWPKQETKQNKKKNNPLNVHQIDESNTDTQKMPTIFPNQRIAKKKETDVFEWKRMISSLFLSTKRLFRLLFLFIFRLPCIFSVLLSIFYYIITPYAYTHCLQNLRLCGRKGKKPATIPLHCCFIFYRDKTITAFL